MSEHFDVAVIGSGFGGSVAAAVLAEGGQRVCVLERGRAYPPGSFPRSPKEMSTAFWDPSEGYHGMFQLWSFRRSDALVSSGLGGGSLIYANVMLRKPEQTYLRWDWQDRREVAGWPVDAGGLASSYEWVERRIGIAPMPSAELPGFGVVRRTDELAKAQEKITGAGFPMDFRRPPLAVAFAPDGGDPQPGAPIPTAFNVHSQLSRTPTYRSTCRLCGECDIGCNYGSKNSLDHTLLSQAAAAGATIKPLHEVKDLQQIPGGGWRVLAQDRSELPASHPAGTCFPGKPVEFTARRVVFAAGTYGTTYLLLRLRQAGRLDFGPALGECVSGNGDLITWVTGSAERLDADRGPVVTGLLTAELDRRVEDEQARAIYYIQDGGYPGLLAWLGETVGPATPARLLRFAARRWWAALRADPNRGLARDVAGLIGTSRSTSTLPLLGIGMDVADGQLRLHPRRQHRLDLQRPAGSSADYYETVSDSMARVAAALGARKFIESPWWSLRRSITVHPLGGCPMGSTSADGVVNGWGEVFGYEDSLSVMDGSVMPGPVGPNPALTIAAFAHRASERVLERATAAV